MFRELGCERLPWAEIPDVEGSYISEEFSPRARREINARDSMSEITIPSKNWHGRDYTYAEIDYKSV